MGEKIGLDFGTAYTVMSRLNANGEIEAIVDTTNNSDNKDYRRATVATKWEDENGNAQWMYGQIARRASGKKYVDFKMLLKESSTHLLHEFGYDDCLPEKVTSDFLNSVINDSYLSRNNSTIEKLVVGVPEIWFKGEHGLNARLELERIIREEVFNVDTVELYGEPVLACAYYINELRKRNNNKPFEGDVVVIDYGGGTLDITVCKVSINKNKSEIKVQIRTGDGQNADRNSNDEKFDMVGRAGHAFLRATLDNALNGKNTSLTKGKYTRLLGDLEDLIIGQRTKFENDVKTILSIRDKKTRDASWDNTFTRLTIDEDGDYLYVKYKHIKDAYDTVIRGTLDEQLNKVKTDYFEKNSIDVRDANIQNVRIVKVGGFSKFYLTNHQINEYFDFLKNNDPRDGDAIINDESKDKAVSYGATLVANDIIKVLPMTPFAIGIAKFNPDTDLKWLNEIVKAPECDAIYINLQKEIKKYEKTNLYYRDEIARIYSYFAIPEGVVIKPGEPIYIQSKRQNRNIIRDQYGIPEKNTPMRFRSSDGIIRYLAICYGDPEEEPSEIKVFETPKEYKTAFESLEKGIVYYIGFSIDISGMLTLHLQNEKTKEEKSFRLKEYRSIDEGQGTYPIGE